MTLPATGVRELRSQHHEQIQELVADHNLDRALQRLLDYARDYSSDRRLLNEAVVLNGRWRGQREDVRRHGPSVEQGRQESLLMTRILELRDEVAESFHLIPEDEPEPDGPEPEPEPDGGTLDQRRLTPLEREKLRFRRERSGELLRRPVLKAQGIGKSYRRNHFFALKGVTFELNAGEILGLVGVNGSGKTSLLNVLAGELAPVSGKVSYPLLEAREPDARRRRRRLAYVRQHPERWTGTMSENLHFAAAMHGLTGLENEEEIAFVLSRLGLDRYRDATWSEISGGFQMRFELARALVSRPTLLILDEPLAPLDIVTQLLFLQDLRDLANSRRHPLAVLMSSQHIYEVEAVADQLLFLDDGVPRFAGALRDLGRDRTENVFEIACSASRKALEAAFPRALSIESFGKSFLLRLNADVGGAQVLSTLMGRDVQIQYFRNVSCSARSLFRTDPRTP